MITKVNAPNDFVTSKICELRGSNVMLDKDLAELYEVKTKALKQAVKRNLDIFPMHFMFELTKEEDETLRSQSVTSNTGRGGTRYLPMAFTEHGVLQVANILRSKKARQMSVGITEVFVEMRKLILNNGNWSAEMDEIKSQVADHDSQLTLIVEYLKQLEETKQEELEKGIEERERREIGFNSKDRTTTLVERAAAREVPERFLMV